MQQYTIPQAPSSSNLDDNPTETSGRGRWRGLVSTIALLIAAPLLALILTAFVFQSYEVEGQSMETTLQNQDRLIVLKVPRTVARITHNAYIPKRGDVIIFVQRGLASYGEGQDEKQLIKRVIGLPGERVVVKDGSIRVYNQEHPDGFNPDTDGGYGITPRFTNYNVDWTVPPGKVFVCGDNRTNSLDSRIFGPISANDIVGKLVFRLLPVSKAKTF